MTFTNFFMWRHFYNFRYAVINNLLCVSAHPEHGAPYALVPIGSASDIQCRQTVEAVKMYYESKGWRLRFARVTEQEVAYMREIAAEDDILLDCNNSDYVYLTENLINLKGKKYDGKRNHINKFKKMYGYEYLPLTKEYIGECERIIKEWYNARPCEEKKELCWERDANMELLANYDVLACKGAVIKVDGRVEAFTVGELLNEDTAVIHIEKANSSIPGLYPFINQQFCLNEWADVKYINREQDLGLAGLRKSKLSYHPEMFVKKYTVEIR